MHKYAYVWSSVGEYLGIWEYLWQIPPTDRITALFMQTACGSQSWKMGKRGGNVGEVGGTRWESDKRAVKIVPHETKWNIHEIVEGTANEL